ncbi:MAG: hypothetical protein ACREJC_14950, partial [Tepidisphaeraceae bacterium]
GGTSFGTFNCMAGGIGIGFPGYQFEPGSLITGPGNLTFDNTTSLLVHADINGLGELRATTSPSTVITFTKPVTMTAQGIIMAQHGATAKFNDSVMVDQVYSYSAGKLIFNGNVTATYGVRLVDPGGEAHFNGALSTISLLGLDTETDAFVGALGADKLLHAYRVELNGTATLDLNDNDLILDYSGSRSAALDAIQALINSARNGGDWTGAGLTSSSARDNPNAVTTLGAMDASDYLNYYGPGTPFSGQTIDSTAVLVKYTYYGDTNFDGTVNLDDYANIDGGYLLNLTGWMNGDFDGSGGKPDLDDYSLIDAAFLTQGAVL